MDSFIDCLEKTLLALSTRTGENSVFSALVLAFPTSVKFPDSGLSRYERIRSASSMKLQYSGSVPRMLRKFRRLMSVEATDTYRQNRTRGHQWPWCRFWLWNLPVPYTKGSWKVSPIELCYSCPAWSPREASSLRNYSQCCRLKQIPVRSCSSHLPDI